MISPSGSVYAISLGGGKALAGSILSSMLGGNGNEPANLVPTSQVAIAKWNAVDLAVYNCLRSGQSGTAKLRWVFSYQTVQDTSPYKVVYFASFVGGPNNCEKIVESIDI